jgi:hypothetical protein
MSQATLPQIEKTLEVADIERLCALTGPCISIFLPAYRPGAGSTPEVVPLKYLLRTASEMPAVRKIGLEAAASLNRLRELAESPELESGGRSVALFSAPEFIAGYRNGWRFGPKLAVGQCPFIRPLLEEAFTPGDVFALGLGRKHLRLFRCHHGEGEELQLPKGVPASLAEAGEFDQPDHDLANRSASGTSTGSRFAVRFGTGTDREAAPAYLHHYFTLIDRGLHPLVKNAPVFLMGVAEETAAFRKAARSLTLLETEATGSTDIITPEQASQKAREAALNWYRQRSRNALSEFRELTDRTRALSGVTKVLAAAENGRVHQLLLAEDNELPAKQRKGLLNGEDVLNAIAVKTIRTGGEVFTLPAPEMDEVSPVAAILRY